MAENKNDNLIDKLKVNKGITSVLLIVSIVLIIALLLGNVFGVFDKSDNTTTESDYIDGLTAKLENVLSQVEGVGKVSCVLTVESGMETVLATKKTLTETNSGKETEETPIIINGKTIVVKEKYPKVIGALIVAEGAENLMTLKRIQQATTSLLNIEINQIEILAMK